jgi:hypothetical protein
MPNEPRISVPYATSLRLAEAVRALAVAARRLGLAVPGFRSPPRLSGAPRTIRRHASGAATVAVIVRERPWPAVAADLVEGIVVANRLTGRAAHDVRSGLWEVLAPMMASGILAA